MQFVDIKIYKLAETKLDQSAVRQWLDDMGATEYDHNDGGSATDAEKLIGLAGKRCYRSFQTTGASANPNVTKVRSIWSEYFDNILRSGHGSVLEHPSTTWAFENVSRVFTSECNRHRAGVAISEQSLRYVRFENIPFWLPNSIKEAEGDSPELRLKKSSTKLLLGDILENIEITYKNLVKLWDFDNMKDFHQKKVITSLLRRIVPLGVATGAVYSFNGRALRHILTMRCDPAAEEEICHVFSMVAKRMVEESPLLLLDFKQTAEGFWYPEYRKV